MPFPPPHHRTHVFELHASRHAEEEGQKEPRKKKGKLTSLFFIPSLNVERTLSRLVHCPRSQRAKTWSAFLAPRPLVSLSLLTHMYYVLSSQTLEQKARRERSSPTEIGGQTSKTEKSPMCVRNGHMGVCSYCTVRARSHTYIHIHVRYWRHLFSSRAIVKLMALLQTFLIQGSLVAF